MGIPLDEAMAVLDTDYASEAYTCASNVETLQEPGDNQDARWGMQGGNVNETWEGRFGCNCEDGCWPGVEKP